MFCISWTTSRPRVGAGLSIAPSPALRDRAVALRLHHTGSMPRSSRIHLDQFDSTTRSAIIYELLLLCRRASTAEVLASLQPSDSSVSSVVTERTLMCCGCGSCRSHLQAYAAAENQRRGRSANERILTGMARELLIDWVAELPASCLPALTTQRRCSSIRG